MGHEAALIKVRAGMEDHKPWTVGVRGSGTDRWLDALATIEMCHGKAAREKIEKEVGR
jgi:hypothetical protein